VIDELPSPATFLRSVIERSEWWTGKQKNSLKSLSYEYKLGNKTRSVKLTTSLIETSNSLWHGTTLQSGIHHLAANPERFSVTAEPSDGKVVRLICKVRDPDDLVSVAFGNGIEGRWKGYFSVTV